MDLVTDIAMYNDQVSTSTHGQVPTPGEHIVQKCSCGRKTSAGAVCTTVLDKYASRCPCYNSRRACNELCSCKNCQNPFGFVVREKCKPGMKRKRRAHETQKFFIRGVKTKAYMEKSSLHYDIG